MPGILPMKMIKVGGNTQSRIAQACDRCRSKKIRCDGIRPCCTQCANVGFECKTSDKLSRRAFPRGYTESLEDRVRSLEGEVRELKELLDEKDEKIDMLSRIHNFAAHARKTSLSPNNTAAVKSEPGSPPLREDVIHVEIPAPVQPTNSSTGNSTTAALLEAFEAKVQESGRSCPNITPTDLLQSSSVADKATSSANPRHICPEPPRLLSDQYINLFFQEWQPMLPILHRPTFLRVYEQYLSGPEARSWQGNRHAVAQLFLIFEIAAHSSSSRTKPNTAVYEIQWRKALSSGSSSPSLAALQCHVLAQLCYLLKADYPHLLRHRACAVSILHQLSLHQGHKYHSLAPLEAETRKKVFWAQYVLDKFASATTGTPQLLRDVDISTEYPADVDDENVSAEGFSPALPGELTKISSALALFRVSRILGRTIENLYPAKASYQLSLTKLHSLSDELDQWQEELPDHLRLRFCNDKPATNLISCRSPLLSLAYFYTRSLIHRPLLCHGSGNASSAARIVLAAAAKHELQIIDLLDERSMNYTFPVSKQDILLNAGFSILWQSLDLDEESKLVQDNQKSLNLMLSKLSKENHFASTNFHKIAGTFVTLQNIRPISTAHIGTNTSTGGVSSTMPAFTDHKQKTARRQLQAIASRLSGLNVKNRNEDVPRRASDVLPTLAKSLSPNPRTSSAVSLSSTKSAPVAPSAYMNSTNHTVDDVSAINLDYFPFGDDFGVMSTQVLSPTMPPPRKTPSISAQPIWEQVVEQIDVQSPELFSTVSPNSLNRSSSVSTGAYGDWTADLWQTPFDLTTKGNVPQSLLSFSEESLTSGDDLVFSAPGSHNGSTATNDTFDTSGPPTMTGETYKGIAIPIDDEFELNDITD